MTVQNLFIFPGIRSISVMEPSEIIYLKAESNYTNVYHQNGSRQLLSKTLKCLETYLPEAIFLRVHRSYVVNRKYIRTITTDSIILINEHVLPISRRKKKSLKQDVISFNNL